jgi:hypothetical protein
MHASAWSQKRICSEFKMCALAESRKGFCFEFGYMLLLIFLTLGWNVLRAQDVLSCLCHHLTLCHRYQLKVWVTYGIVQ